MPNETNWQDITRRLDITPATQTDACNHKTRARGRAITKVPYSFIIPAANIDTSLTGIAQRGALVRQLNYTAPSNFKMLSWTSSLATTDISNLAIVCIRYREGGTVYRYRMHTTNETYYDDILDVATGVPVPAPLYTNQRIKANFCIEFWSSFGFGETIDMREFTVLTNLLLLPANANTTGTTFEKLEQLERADLALAMPETLPVTYGASSSWLTN